MKIESNTYEYDPNITLHLIPETDVEKTLLKALWKHGRLEFDHTGCAITTMPEKQHYPPPK